MKITNDIRITKEGAERLNELINSPLVHNYHKTLLFAIRSRMPKNVSKSDIDLFSLIDQMYPKKIMDTPVRPVGISPASFVPEFKPTGQSGYQDHLELLKLPVPKGVTNYKEAIRSGTKYGNIVKNLLTKVDNPKQVDKVIKRGLLLQLIRKYKPSYSEEEFRLLREATHVPSVWSVIMDRPPANFKERKDADIMQSIIYDVTLSKDWTTDPTSVL